LWSVVKVCAGSAMAVVAHSATKAHALVVELSLPKALPIRSIKCVRFVYGGFPSRGRSDYIRRLPGPGQEDSVMQPQNGKQMGQGLLR